MSCFMFWNCIATLTDSLGLHTASWVYHHGEGDGRTYYTGVGGGGGGCTQIFACHSHQIIDRSARGLLLILRGDDSRGQGGFS